MAAWYGVPSVIALGGMDFGRCYPYDPYLAPVAELPLSVSSPMDCFGCQGTCRYPVIPGRCAPCLEAVGVEAMWEAVKRVLSETVNR
ncbi:glycosyl transferase family 9 [mine drainage metagenome]|uniref:Glycosyl transferase family 9 n=1 Tax=mine drainage metagenome TaxID=410659 RepID=T0Y400_9ZZZZ